MCGFATAPPSNSSSAGPNAIRKRNTYPVASINPTACSSLKDCSDTRNPLCKQTQLLVANTVETSNMTETMDAYGNPRIPFRGHHTKDTADARRAWVEAFTGAELKEIGRWWGPEEGEDENTVSATKQQETSTPSSVSKKIEKLKNNIEMPIGLIKIPIAAAGPLKFNGAETQGFILCPMATTEGALVASATRGAAALNQSGGAKVESSRQRMVRAPFWTLGTKEQVPILQEFIEKQIGVERIRKVVAEHSSHAKLLALEFYPVGDTLHLRFVYETGDAAGQNMTTTTTWEACRMILHELESMPNIQLIQFCIEGNLASDKKASVINKRLGRGISATATAIVPSEVVYRVLKADPILIVKGLKTMAAARHHVGSICSSINAANIIGAVFAACGQDIASVYESSVADFVADWVPADAASGLPTGGIRYTLTLPCLVVGTVGGGTGLPTQRECLSIMDCIGRGKARRLAEIIAGYCLALDISTSAAIASQQFARAHESLGRNRPELGLRWVHIDNAFATRVVSSALQQLNREQSTDFEVLEWKMAPIDSSSSILAHISASGCNFATATAPAPSEKMIGLFGVDIMYKTRQTPHYAQDLRPALLRTVIKAKATDRELIHSMNQIAIAAGPPVSSLYDRVKYESGFRNCHVRELAVQKLLANADGFDTLMPRVFHVASDKALDVFVSVMERLIPHESIECAAFAAASSCTLSTTFYATQHVILMDKADAAPLYWTYRHVATALRDVGAFHARFLMPAGHSPHRDLLRLLPVLELPSVDRARLLKPFLVAMLDHTALEFAHVLGVPASVSPSSYAKSLSRVDLLAAVCCAYPDVIAALKEEHPATLVHNDFSPRNACLRVSAGPDRATSLVAYDWELATVHAPQRDAAEFLCFTMREDSTPSEWLRMIEVHRMAVSASLDAMTAGNDSSHLVQLIKAQISDAVRWREGFDLCVAEFVGNRLMFYGLAHAFKSFGFFERVLGCACGYLAERIAVSSRLQRILGMERGFACGIGEFSARI